MRRLWGRSMLICALSLSTAACRSIATERYHGFADLTNEIFTNAQETDDRVHLIHVRYRVVTAPDVALTPSSFQAASDAADAGLAEALEIRTAAVGVMLHYSRLIDAMASGEPSSVVAKMAVDLEPSVREFQEVSGLSEAAAETTAATAAIRPRTEVDSFTVSRAALANLMFLSKHSVRLAIGPAAARLMAAAIGTGTLQMVSKRRQSQLLTIMEQSQPDLEALSSIVARSNESIRKATEIMAAEIVSRANDVRPPRSDPYRIAFDADIADLLENKDTILSNLDSLEVTMKHFPLAHAELMALLQRKPTRKESLSRLSREAQRIEQDYQSLK